MPIVIKSQQNRIRAQYHFRRSKDGRLLIWDVRKLITKSKNFKIIQVKLSDIKSLDTCYWFDDGGSTPTCRNIVEHTRLINEADLSYPIILCKRGEIMDGMHRVCKALLLGYTHIDAVQFESEITPDYIDVNPEILAYD
ncbi:ParB N-terminal domain-containing protein [Facilibium subflavum]|uniref:hypothetical protein n=1 Tax=Facilibium subflavum TaxID=2219058 RepID=UPI001F36E66E|nr:hypothetical protein [Facilibium subflavum]